MVNPRLQKDLRDNLIKIQNFTGHIFSVNSMRAALKRETNKRPKKGFYIIQVEFQRNNDPGVTRINLLYRKSQ